MGLVGFGHTVSVGEGGLIAAGEDVQETTPPHFPALPVRDRARGQCEKERTRRRHKDRQPVTSVSSAPTLCSSLAWRINASSRCAEVEHFMPIYIALLTWTEQGAKNAKDALRRNQEGRAAIERAGGRLIGSWWTQGAYDASRASVLMWPTGIADRSRSPAPNARISASRRRASTNVGANARVGPRRNRSRALTRWPAGTTTS
jgi:GYD domain